MRVPCTMGAEDSGFGPLLPGIESNALEQSAAALQQSLEMLSGQCVCAYIHIQRQTDRQTDTHTHMRARSGINTCIQARTCTSTHENTRMCARTGTDMRMIVHMYTCTHVLGMH